MDVFGELSAIVLPIFIAAAIGFAWARRGSGFNSEFVTSIVSNFGTPCLIFSALSRLDIATTTYSGVALATAIVVVCFAVTGIGALRLTGLPMRSFLPSLMFTNAGNMGLPLCLFAFGEDGLGLGIVFFAVTSMGQFTIGQAISAGAANIGQLLRAPIIYALAAAVLFLATGESPPAWLANSTQLIGWMTIPLMLLSLGVSLSRLRVASFRNTLFLSLLRLGMGVGIGYGVADLMALEGVARGVVILQSAMPTAVFNYLFAARYGRTPEDVAGVVVLSTIISFATLPLLLLLVL